MTRLALTCGLVLLFAPQPASACSCSGPRNALEARSAPLILKGRVIRMEYRDLPLAPLDATEYREPIAVTFEVARSWKRRTPTITVVTTGMGGSDCGYGFVPGIEYVVPVYEGGAGELVTGLCAGVQSIWAARSILPRLGPGYEPTPSLESLNTHDPRARMWPMALLGYSGLALATLILLCLGLYAPRRDRDSTGVRSEGSSTSFRGN